MPLLIAIGLAGLLAIMGGTALAQFGVRRSPEPASALAAGAPTGSRTLPSAPTVLFVVALAYFTAIAAVLTFHYGSIMGDAESRVADAWYVFFTRDPHLAAIGFVWNPLPSILVMPFAP